MTPQDSLGAVVALGLLAAGGLGQDKGTGNIRQGARQGLQAGVGGTGRVSNSGCGNLSRQQQILADPACINGDSARRVDLTPASIAGEQQGKDTQGQSGHSVIRRILEHKVGQQAVPGFEFQQGI
jgi:hypothetical protein